MTVDMCELLLVVIVGRKPLHIPTREQEIVSALYGDCSDELEMGYAHTVHTNFLPQ